MASKATEKPTEKVTTDSMQPEVDNSLDKVPTQTDLNTLPVEGLLQMFQDYGVLRVFRTKEMNGDEIKDVYISQSQIRRFSLRPGDLVSGHARFPKESERYLSLLRIDSVNGNSPEKIKERPKFEKLTPIFPHELISIETSRDIFSTRLIDLVSPIGKGQRAMIVAPPKSGKTWLLKDIANGISINHPDINLFVSLIGERPEEVTDMKRNVKGEVFASNFDEPAERHVQSAEFVLERAKRLAEVGNDVVILLDSITRLARAYNMSVPPSGRTLSGGFDPVALYPPKRFFGAARCFEEGGSLTIVATALVDTGSRMDDLIYEEFKGTGNMELHLDRRLADRRIFPTIDIIHSGTRHEEKLYPEETMKQVWKLRRMIDTLNDNEATELVIQRLGRTKDNKEFLATLTDH
ncbi:transcription termination factor Rho [candidate division WWE3 bacterium RIFCSPLOWO2_01_FULL_42_11]|uniref:Transcription termination factor Rho n=1 Tax=candidate division WWE3 bacterium RIFCSPLOWO2_01_FULL_42_11 TaxID=1802627 RepID=A0A1F4VPV9_UNCKA|nr:MAG: transcription termination factor Rho [candidate division WWE3 bacterium RIFCSPLOWO2_01_FULL_42_11]